MARTIQRPRQEPRRGVSKHRCGLIEQAFRLGDVAGRKGDRRHPGQRIPEPPRDRQRPEPFNAAGEVVAGRVRRCRRSVRCARTDSRPARPSSMSPALVGEREGARERGACVPEFSLRVPHRAVPRSALDSAAGGRDGRFRICSYHWMPSAACPRITQKKNKPPRDVGCFGGAAALDEPRQGAAVALEIVTHAIQPFDLRRSDQPLRSEGGFARRNSAPAPPWRRRARPPR